MRTFIIGFLLLVTNCISMYSQSHTIAERYYYYKGEKIYFKVNKERFIVFHEADQNFENNLKNRYNLLSKKGQSMSKSGQLIYATEVKLSEDEKYLAEVEYLKRQKTVKTVEIVIGDSITVPVADYFYVKLKDITDTIYLNQIAAETKSTILNEIPYCKNWFLLEVNKHSISDCIGVANIFVESGLFDKVDPGFLIEIDHSCVSDEGFDNQWAINDDGVDINACAAWDLTTGEDDVILALLDTGIDTDHDEFVLTNFTTSYDAEGYKSPAKKYDSHGTKVGGVIGSSHNLDELAGIAPDLSIMNISKDFNNSYHAENRIASGINWAVQNGADIINNSWYFSIVLPNTSELIEDAIDNAIDNGRGGLGCIVVFASGNGVLFNLIRPVTYPANYRSEILCVGSNDSQGKVSGFSCFGDELDIVAPGESIWTTTYSSLYSNVDGTSFAAPYAAGVAGLILSRNSHLTDDQVIDIIESTAQKLGGYDYTTTTGRTNGTWYKKMGYGVLDAEEAVSQCPKTVLESITFSESVDEIRACGEVEFSDIDVEDDGGFFIISHDGVLIEGPFDSVIGSEIIIH